MPSTNQEKPNNINAIMKWLMHWIAAQTSQSELDIDVNLPFSKFKIKTTALRNALTDWLGFEVSSVLIWEYPCIAQLAKALAITCGLVQEKGAARAVQYSSTAEPIAIVGMGCRLPGGINNPEDYWQFLLGNKDAITKIPNSRWDINQYFSTNRDAPGKLSTQYGGFIEHVDEFDAAFFNIDDAEAVLMDPQQRIALEVTVETLEHAGIAFNQLAGKPAGIFVGVCANDYDRIQCKYTTAEQCNEYYNTGRFYGSVAGRIANFLDLHGPALAVDTACSSSLVAVHLACQSLRDKECDVALSGGVYVILDPDPYISFCKMHMAAPDGKAKTFDEAASGTVRSEGCGMLVLKRLSDAIKDGNAIYAVIHSTAVNQNGQNQSMNAPGVDAQVQLFQELLAKANVKPDQIDYVEAHGMATAVSDSIEVDAIKRVFADKNRLSPLWIGNLKPRLGHLLPASGIASLMKSILCIYHEMIPANLHFNKLNSFINLDAIPAKLPLENTPWLRQDKVRYATVSSFGAIGTNAQALLGEAPKSASSNLTEKFAASLIVLSAKNANALHDAAERLLTFIQNHPDIKLEELAYNLAITRNHFQSRMAFIVESRDACLDFLVNRRYESISLPIGQCYEVSNDFYDQALTLNNQGAWRHLLESVKKEYLSGASIDWQKLYKLMNSCYQKINLPTYPFQRKRYWVADAETTKMTENFPTLSENSKLVDDDMQLEQKKVGTKASAFDLYQDLSENELYEKLTGELLEYLSKLMDIPAKKININKGFYELGLNSLLIEELMVQLAKQFGDIVENEQTLLFDYPSIASLAAFLVEQISKTKKSFPTEIQTSTSAREQDDIAVIGMSCRLPGGANNNEAYWQLLVNQENVIEEIPASRWNVSRYFDQKPGLPGKMYTRYGGFVHGYDQFDPLLFGISPREALEMDPRQRLLLATSWEAIEIAGYAPQSLNNTNMGVYVGAGHEDYAHVHEPSSQHDEGGIYSVSGVLLSALAGRLSFVLGVVGPSITFDAACSASLVAVQLACESLRNHECHLALAAGVNISLDPQRFIRMSQALAFSPTGECRTFDADANGYVASEGCGVVILKRYKDAVRDRDNILACIKAVAINQDGHSGGFSVPNRIAQENVMLEALAKSKCKPIDVQYVETHGTGTKLGDPIEVRAIQSVYGQGRTKESPLILGAVKTNVGHLEQAAGMASLAKVILCLQHKKIPANIHFNKLNPKINLANIPAILPNELMDWHSPNGLRTAGISTFSFVGTNAHCIVQEAPVYQANKVACCERPWQLFMLSAKTKTALNNYIHNMLEYLQKTNDEIASICYTANCSRSLYPYRIAILCNSKEDLIEKIKEKKYDITYQENNLSIIRLKSVGSDYKNDSCDIVELTNKLDHVLQSKKYEFNTVLNFSGEGVGVEQWLRLMEKVADLYKNGFVFDWNAFDNVYLPNRKKVIMPTYPFDNQSYWKDVAVKDNDLGTFDGTAKLHPLLGKPLNIANFKIYQNKINLTELDYLKDHVVFQTMLLPGSAFVEMFLAAAKNQQINAIVHINELSLLKAMVLENDKFIQVQVNNQGEVSIYEQGAGHESHKDWLLNAQAKISNKPGGACDQEAHCLEEILKHLNNSKHGKMIQEYCNKLHMEHGAKFKTLTELNLVDRKVYAKLSTQLLTNEYLIHPTLLDGCFQAISILASQQSMLEHTENPHWLPIKLTGVDYLNMAGNTIYLVAELTNIDSKQIHAKMSIYDGSGTLVVTIDDYTARLVSENAFVEKIVAKAIPTAIYTTQWLLEPFVVEKREPLPKQWAVIADEQDLLLLKNDVAFTQQTLLSRQKLHDLNGSQQLHFMLESYKDITDIIYVVNGAHKLNVETMVALFNQHVAALLFLLQSLLHNGTEKRLWLVTVNGQAVDANDTVNPMLTSFVGFFKSVAIEQTQLHISYVDASSLNDIKSILYREQINTMKNIIAYRGENRYVANLVSVQEYQQDQYKQFLPEAPFKMQVAESRLINDVALQKINLSQLASDELAISVRANSLNFRDVLIAMGLYPEQDAELGVDFSGVITEVGNSVSQFKVGDEVMGLADGCMASDLHIKPALVVKKPSSLSFEDAAAIPAIYLTTWVALKKLAKLKKNEWLLIHSAAGGVGLSAIQYANEIGANVIATASTPEKREFLKAQGVKYVYNSRNFNYVEEIQRDLKGKGVDVILNYATGDYIAETLKISAPGARFIEIGKRDIWSTTKMTEHRPDIEYHILVLGDYRIKEPEVTLELLHDIVNGFAEGRYKPIPTQCFPMSQAIVAMDQFRRAKHIGKIILYHTRKFTIKTDASYVITGGLGGVGFELLKWLVMQGAKNILLIQRSQANEEQMKVIEKLSQANVAIELAQVDITNTVELLQCLKRYNDHKPIVGIFHLAGVLDDGIVSNLNLQSYQKVFMPKALGAWNLHQCSQELALKLDCFVLFSSTTASIGSPGQSNYAMANAYLDGLASYRRKLNLPALSINWGAFQGSGMSSTHKETQIDTGIIPMAAESAFESMKEAMSMDMSNVSITAVDWQRFCSRLMSRIGWLEKWCAQPQLEKSESQFAILQVAKPKARIKQLRIYLRSLLREILKIKEDIEISDKQGFFDLGMDSLLALEFRSRLQLAFEHKIEFPETFLIDCPSIATAIDYIIEKIDKATPAQAEDSTCIEDITVDAMDENMLRKMLEEETRKSPHRETDNE